MGEEKNIRVLILSNSTCSHFTAAQDLNLALFIARWRKKHVQTCKLCVGQGQPRLLTAICAPIAFAFAAEGTSCIKRCKSKADVSAESSCLLTWIRKGSEVKLILHFQLTNLELGCPGNLVTSKICSGPARGSAPRTVPAVSKGPALHLILTPAMLEGPKSPLSPQPAVLPRALCGRLLPAAGSQGHRAQRSLAAWLSRAPLLQQDTKVG